MASDTDLWKAAQKSLDEFGKVYGSSNPAATLQAYNLYKSSSLEDITRKSPSGSGGSESKSWNPLKNFTAKVGNVITSAAATQEQTGSMPQLSDEMISASEATKGMFDMITSITDPLSLVEKALSVIGSQAELYLKQQTELLGVVNKEAGLTGQFSADVRDELTKANAPLARLGIGFKDLADGAKNLITDSGRFLTLNRESWTDAGMAATAYVGTLGDLVQMFPSFEKIGIGAGDVAKNIELVGSRSLSLGLQSQKTTKELATNLSKLNEYGFKGGIQGMAEMVRKSTEFRINMQSVYDIADKVFDPEGAIDMAANLQAIGGAIGDFNDPLKLMYMATNDAEGLQDALIGAAGGLATYNEEQGRFEITGVNLRKAKAMAKELGISYSELANGAIAAAERSSAASALMGKGLKMDEDTQRFITNISSMKDGQMTIALNSDKLREVFKSNEISLDNLSQSQVDLLKKYQDEFKEMSPEDIVRQQATSIENIMRDVNFIAATARVAAADKGGKYLKDIQKLVGYEPGDMERKSKQAADAVASYLKPGTKIEPTTNVNVEPSKPQSVPVDNSKPAQTNSPTAANTETQSTKTELTLNVKSDPIMDEFSRYIVRRPETIDAFLNSSSPRDYTSQA